MNLFIFTGNLGKDCRTNNVNGTAVVNFSVAVKSGYGDKEQTVWVECAIWGKKAEGRLPEFLLKGQQVAASGELSLRTYQSEDGTQKTSLACRVNDLDLIGGKSEAVQERQPEPQNQSQNQSQNPSTFDDCDDDIPF